MTLLHKLCKMMARWFFGEPIIEEEPCENEAADLALSPPCVTYIFGCGFEHDEWITHWEVRP